MEAFLAGIGNPNIRFIDAGNRWVQALRVAKDSGATLLAAEGSEAVYSYDGDGAWNLSTGAIQFDYEGHRIYAMVFKYMDQCDGLLTRYLFGAERLENIEPLFDAVDALREPPERQCWLVGNETVQDEDLLEALKQYTWDDLVMEDDLKTDLRTTAEAVFSEASAAVFTKMGLPRKRGIILCGPPGNGKTMTGKVVAGAVGASLIYVTNTRQASMFREKKPKEVFQEVFDLAHQLAPCVVVLEELDGLLDAESRPTLLTLLDGLVPNDGVLTIATTNHLERMDAAITKRPSRFDRIFEFGQPTSELSERYLIRRFSQAYREDDQLLEDVVLSEALLNQIKETAYRSSSLSFAALQEIVIGAASAVATNPLTCVAEALRRSADVVISNFGDDEIEMSTGDNESESPVATTARRDVLKMFKKSLG